MHSPATSPFDRDSMREIHVEITFNGRLRIGHDEVDLLEGPAEGDAKDDHETNGKPGDDWRVGFEVVDSIGLLAAVDVEPSLVLLDLVGSQVTLASHGPDRRDSGVPWRDLRLANELPVAIIDVAVDFLDDCLLEFLSIVLPHCLMVVHDVANHLRMERDGMTHAILQGKMLVVMLGQEVFIVHKGLGSHVVTLSTPSPCLAIGGILHPLRWLPHSPSGTDGGLQ